MTIFRTSPATLAFSAIVLGALLTYSGQATADVMIGEDEFQLLDSPSSFTADGTAKVHDGSDNKITASTRSQYLSPTTNAPATEDNVQGFFDIENWVFNDGNSNDDNENREGGTGQSGDWAITNPDRDNFVYMITFKDGEGTSLISFLLDVPSIDSGEWDTPFENPPFDAVNSNPRDVSHFAIFQSPVNGDIPGGEQEIPVPATLGLLGFGLLAAGFAMRRRRF